MGTTPAPTHHRPTGGQTAAAGLTMFAAVMLFIGGILDVFRGIMGIAHDDVFVHTANYVFRFNLTGWGWIHLVLGLIAMVVGIGLFLTSGWARAVGVVVAALLIIANFLTLPYSPLWSLTLIALYGFIIWALCVVQDGTTVDQL